MIQTYTMNSPKMGHQRLILVDLDASAATFNCNCLCGNLLSRLGGWVAESPENKSNLSSNWAEIGTFN